MSNRNELLFHTSTTWESEQFPHALESTIQQVRERGIPLWLPKVRMTELHVVDEKQNYSISHSFIIGALLILCKARGYTLNITALNVGMVIWFTITTPTKIVSRGYIDATQLDIATIKANSENKLVSYRTLFDFEELLHDENHLNTLGEILDMSGDEIDRQNGMRDDISKALANHIKAGMVEAMKITSYTDVIHCEKELIDRILNKGYWLWVSSDDNDSYICSTLKARIIVGTLTKICADKGYTLEVIDSFDDEEDHGYRILLEVRENGELIIHGELDDDILSIIMLKEGRIINSTEVMTFDLVAVFNCLEYFKETFKFYDGLKSVV